MGLWSILLRVLLATALVLNGTGAAMAAVAMESQPIAASEAPVAVSKAEHPCHEMAGAAELAAEPEQSPPPAPDAKHPAPDCCKSSTCGCACVHGAQAATPAVVSEAQAPGRTPVPLPLATGHAAPALPHLIRPPIG